MSENNSRSYTQIAAIVWALCIPAVPVIGTVLTPDKYPGSAYKDYSNRCTECLTIADSGKDQQKRYCKPEQPDWCGLAAQYRSAAAAESSRTASWVIALFTIVGVLLLWVTLRETRAVTRATREIGKDQGRAYINATDAFLHKHSKNLEVELENSGQSPAKKFSVQYVVSYNNGPTPKWAGDFSDFADYSERGEWSALGAHEKTRISIPIGPGYDHLNSRKNSFVNGSEWLAVRGLIEYETIFGELFETKFVYATELPVSFEGDIRKDEDGTPYVLMAKPASAPPLTAFRFIDMPNQEV